MIQLDRMLHRRAEAGTLRPQYSAVGASIQDTTFLLRPGLIQTVNRSESDEGVI
ncbi:hypothetical protein ACPOL_4603 [Acidisarcina polymorpha]|uniref:Uncharacterized protein n=1 Tax=Acidisarcina polymorpha TaxID=2211140 RepID=A0A2Z5G5F2_9BACT|nr:hypothetical protein ACPOL_4603 [Acidisarcina polymorpha]